jgi:hypothetical protein
MRRVRLSGSSSHSTWRSPLPLRILSELERSPGHAPNLARDPRVVIHLDSGDDVVILHGEVEPYELQDSIADAYEAKYDYRPEPREGWFLLQPRRALAWLERDYPKIATRFDFDA